MRWPCFYGIDFATRAELVANGLSLDEIRHSIGADSLAYVSLDELVEATTLPRERLCTACFSGEYPVALPDAEHLGKHLLERGTTASPASTDATLEVTAVELDAEGLTALVGGGGASDALSRP